MNPYEVLNIISPQKARSKFFYLLHKNPKNRPAICLAFDIICNKSKYFKKNGLYHPIIRDEFYFATIGDLNNLKAKLNMKKDKNILNLKDPLGRSLLYISARNGYDDIVEFLIKFGANINIIQRNGSTPLHGASFYGHKSIVKLLIENGSNPNIKNNWGNYAQDEANDSIKRIITDFFYNNKIFNLYDRLYSQGKVTNLLPIKRNGKIICYKLICKNEFNHQEKSDYTVVWHGTKYQYLESIVINGLKPSGTKISDKTIIEPPFGHIPLDQTVNGIKNWAKAVFVSPSCLYSSLNVYSETIQSNNKNWKCLVEGRVKNNEYSGYRATSNRKYADNLLNLSEPSLVEYRVENSNYLFVTSVVFISQDFINNINRYRDSLAIQETEEESILNSSDFNTIDD